MAVALQVMRREEIVEHLIRVHGKQLVSYLSRMLRQPAIAEEVAQDTYVKLLGWDQLEDRPPEIRKAAMFRIGYRLAINRIRRRHAAARGELAVAAEHADPVFESLALPERHVMAEQALAQLNEIIDALPERLREPWVLRYIEELPREAICMRLGITASNLDQRITEVRRICEERMTSTGFDWLWLK